MSQGLFWVQPQAGPARALGSDSGLGLSGESRIYPRRPAMSGSEFPPVLYELRVLPTADRKDFTLKGRSSGP